MLILKKTTQWIQLRMINTAVRFRKNSASENKKECLQLRAIDTGEESKTLKTSFSKPSTVSRRREVEEREDISVLVSSRIRTRLIRKNNLSSRINKFKEWVRHPMNAAFLLWLICVAISATMLGLLSLGLLDGAFPTEDSRNQWMEIDNQVLNALFTLLCLYQHPSLFHHSILLFRWKSEDIIELRKAYSKNGAYHPCERVHMMLVVALQHSGCFAQYLTCGLYWGYSREQRPEFAENFLLAVGVLAPIIAELYTIYSPLGRKFTSDTVQEQQDVFSLNNKNNEMFKFPVKQL